MLNIWISEGFIGFQMEKRLLFPEGFLKIYLATNIDISAIKSVYLIRKQEKLGI